MALFSEFTWYGLAVLVLAACNNDDSPPVSEAIRHGVGAECSVDKDCVTEGSRCLTQFKGGYCGLSNCTGDAECPAGSVCVTHDDGTNYCFLVCGTKPDCNIGRSALNEANCVSNITLVNASNTTKACVPPNG